MSEARKRYWQTASRDDLIKANMNRITTDATKKKMSNSAKERVTDEFKASAAARMSVLVCRISDRKVMNVGNFFRYQH